MTKDSVASLLIHPLIAALLPLYQIVIAKQSRDQIASELCALGRRNHLISSQQIVVANQCARRRLSSLVNTKDLQCRLRHLGALHNHGDDWLRTFLHHNRPEERR